MPRVAAIQMNSGDDVDHNLKLTRELVAAARDAGAQMAVLPECFALMAKDQAQRIERAEPADRPGPIETFLAELANELQIWILASGVFVRSTQSDMVRNATFVFDSSGERVSRYDKINLFDVSLAGGERYAESEYTEAGRELVVQQTPAGVCGLTVCYDVRFPALYERLSAMGASWFVVPSAFAYTTGRDHWEILLRARAIENHAYVVAPAQWGMHAGGRRTYGNSLISDPWGKVIAHQADGDGAIVADIEFERVQSIRSRFKRMQD